MEEIDFEKTRMAIEAEITAFLDAVERGDFEMTLQAFRRMRRLRRDAVTTCSVAQLEELDRILSADSGPECERRGEQYGDMFANAVRSPELDAILAEIWGAGGSEDEADRSPERDGNWAKVLPFARPVKRRSRW